MVVDWYRSVTSMFWNIKTEHGMVYIQCPACEVNIVAKRFRSHTSWHTDCLRLRWLN